MKSFQWKTTSFAYKTAVTSAKRDLESAKLAGGGTGATACPGRCVQQNICNEMPGRRGAAAAKDSHIGLETRSFLCV